MENDAPQYRELTDEEAIVRARKLYGSDDIEVDDGVGDPGAMCSRGTDGCFVRAWVWVPYPEIEDSGE